jgi:hypothetical protein
VLAAVERARRPSGVGDRNGWGRVDFHRLGSRATRIRGDRRRHLRGHRLHPLGRGRGDRLRGCRRGGIRGRGLRDCGRSGGGCLRRTGVCRSTGVCRRPGVRRRLGRDSGSDREERERVDVALLIRGQAHSEVHVRLGEVDGAARPDRAHHRPLRDRRPARDADRAEMDERRRVAGRRLDRDGLPAGRNRPGKGHDTFRRCDDVRARRTAEVDASVLPGGVRMRTVKRKRPQHGPVDGPRPCLRRRHRQNGRAQDQQDSESPHERVLLLLSELRTDRP